MDTDFVYKIETKDFYKDIAKDRQTGHYQDHSLAVQGKKHLWVKNV